ncbi:MAG TPA: DUF2330 domain-containing protein, partial [Polyangiaceae bacterium]|nr:DUF2330 domain-containing protein [Polyangiaceae bacterium]
MKTKLSFAVAVLSAFLLKPAPARACGGCFHPPPQPNQHVSVITDHRMAFSISTTQTVLWDQIRYSGDAGTFAWVLPVGQGARVELAQDDWLAALDAVTAPVIEAPVLPASCQSVGGSFGGGGGGCGAGADNSFSPSGTYGYDSSVAFDSGDGVQVISQQVVGPYEAVTIRSTNGGDIAQWLTDNGFDIPPNIQPILDAYTNEGLDFIALKLAPNQGVQAMQPVRVITPGADPTLPLRMVSAGIGSSVGITLYVIAEGRYETANFTPLVIDRPKVVWDPVTESSNYSQLFADAVADGKGWVTESSSAASSLSNAYLSGCTKLPPVGVACPASDAGTSEAGAADASTDDAADADADAAGDADADADANADAAATPDAGSCTVSACTQFTDYTVATTGMNAYDIQVTRLRTTLPALALSVDLKLRASAVQNQLSPTIKTTAYSDPSYDPCPQASSSSGSAYGACSTTNRSA